MIRTINIKKLLLTVLATLVVIAGSMGNGMGEERVYKIKFATPAPESHPWYFPKAMNPFKEEVERKSNGRLKIEYYPSQILVKVGQGVQALQGRVADVINFVTAWQPGLFPRHELFYLPGTCSSSVKFNNAMYRELLPKYFQKDWEKNNMHVFGWYIPSAYGVYHLKKPIYKVEDFKGIDLLAWSAQQNKVLKSLGVDLQTGTLMDMYSNLQKGIADGLSHNEATVKGYKIYELGKPGYYSEVGGLGGGDAFYAMYKPFYDKLPKDLKKIFDEAARRWLQDGTAAAYDNATSGAVQALKDAGIKYIIWSGVEKKRLRDGYLLPALKKWAQEKEAKGIPATEIVEAISKYRAAGGM